MSPNPKKTIEILFEAYKLGGFPLVLVIAGMLILILGTPLDSYRDIIPRIEPSYFVIAGVLITLAGVAMWALRATLKHRMMIEVAGCLKSLIEGAGVAAREGAGYNAALDGALQKFPTIVEAFGNQAKLK